MKWISNITKSLKYESQRRFSKDLGYQVNYQKPQGRFLKLSLEITLCLDSVLFEILFGIIIIALFMMWCMWDKKMVENIKKWVGKCVYDASEILFGIIRVSKQTCKITWIQLIQTQWLHISLNSWVTKKRLKWWDWGSIT